MLCSRCMEINFHPLIPGDGTYVYHVLHQTRSSYSKSLSRRCQLCTLISSQLGSVEITNSICDQLGGFVVLKRPRPATNDPKSPVEVSHHFPVNIISRLGSGSSPTIPPLPGQNLHALLEEISTLIPLRRIHTTRQGVRWKSWKEAETKPEYGRAA